MESSSVNQEKTLSKRIETMEKRKLKMQHTNKSVWFGLGMFGMVGWSVATPAVLGALLGAWLDKTHKATFSWTLSLLLAGLFSGCLIAWYWVSGENKKMHQDINE